MADKPAGGERYLVGGRRTGGRVADRADAGGCGVKARLNFNLKFNPRSAAVKPAVKFRGPTTGCTLTRRGPGWNITRTLRTTRAADGAAVTAGRSRAAG